MCRFQLWFLQGICPVVELLGHMIVLILVVVCLFFFFFFLRNLRIVLRSGYINLHPHQQSKRLPFSPHSLQYLLFVDILIVVILTSVRWYLMWFWFAFANDKQCWTFFHVLIIYMSSLEKCSSVFCPLFYWVVCFSNIELYEMLVYFGVNSLSVASFAISFFHSQGCLFIL